MSKTKYENIQSDLVKFIPEACFFLSLLSVAEDAITDFRILDRHIDLIDAYHVARKSGWLGSDNIMYNDVALLEYLIGKRVGKEVLPPASELNVADNEYTITKWQKGLTTHFRRRGYDVYKDSQTVKKGKCVAIYKYRVSI